MRKPKSQIVELPQELEKIAQDLSKIIADAASSNLEILLNKKPEQSKSWNDFIGSIAPEDVNQWSSKDFVHYFVQNLNRSLQIPYVVEYSRDCSSIKKIKNQLLEVGISDGQILKDFLNWSIKNHHRIKEESERFDLPTLNKYLNDFLQHSNEVKEDRSLGFNIVEKMEKEEENNKKTGMVSLLKQFGIPLTAQYYYSKGFKVEEIMNGIEIRLKRFGEKDIMLLQGSVQRSIDFSPYPDWFCFLDWRNRYSEIIEQYGVKNLKWWRDVDYGGNFAIEYDLFGEMNGKS